MRQRTLAVTLFGASFLFSLVGAAATPPGAAGKDPADTSELAAPKIRILAMQRTEAANQQFFSFSCDASNPNKAPVMFVGYRADAFDPPIPEGSISPIYSLEFQRDGKWKEHPIGWCGTGMDGIELLAGKSQKFECAVPADAAIKAVRVGIRWSKPVEFDSAEPDVFKVAWSEPLELKKLVDK
jgi:hypothetical protein